MDNFNVVVGVVGAAGGIISIWMATKGLKKKLIGFFGLACIALATYFFADFAIRKDAKLKRLELISRQANALVDRRKMDFTSKGFVIAGLSFLEANKTELPDTYQRALALCKNYKCTTPDKELQSGSNSIEAEFIMSSILRGIAIIKSE